MSRLKAKTVSGAMVILWLGCVNFAGSGKCAAADYPNTKAAASPATPVHGSGADYVLGPGDQILVRVVNLDEIGDKPTPIDMSGHIHLPVAGTLKAAGLTVAQLQSALAAKVSKYVLAPDVSVSVVEFHSQPVSVIGSVKNAGVLQVQGRKTVVEMLSLAGGIDATAGSTVEITRRLDWGRIPLPDAHDDASGKYSVARINLKSLISARNPEENILVEPYDVISVPRAETVYVMGEVMKPGGFPLDSHEEVTVLQALSMAGGFDKTASGRKARLLRVNGNDSRAEVPIDLLKILDGKTADVAMLPNDILFVPNNFSKKAAIKAAETAVQIGTGVIVWGRY